MDISFTAKQASSSLPRQAQRIEPPTEAELDVFYKTLDSSAVKPAILKITPQFSEQFMPHLSLTSLPPPISQLYDQDALQLDYPALLRKCEKEVRTLKVSVGLGICMHDEYKHIIP